MDIINEIQNTFKIDDKKIIIFQILGLYLKDEENLNCFQSIIEVYNNLYNNMQFYSMHQANYQDQRLINRMKNDLDTYNELKEEFGKYVYPLFSSFTIILLTNQPVSDLEIILEFLTKQNNCYNNIDILNKIKECLNIFADEETKNKIIKHIEDHNIDNVSIDQTINYFKNKKRELTNPTFNKLYDELIGMYFDNLNKR